MEPGWGSTFCCLEYDDSSRALHRADIRNLALELSACVANVPVLKDLWIAEVNSGTDTVAFSYTGMYRSAAT